MRRNQSMEKLRVLFVCLLVTNVHMYINNPNRRISTKDNLFEEYQRKKGGSASDRRERERERVDIDSRVHGVCGWYVSRVQISSIEGFVWQMFGGVDASKLGWIIMIRMMIRLKLPKRLGRSLGRPVQDEKARLWTDECFGSKIGGSIVWNDDAESNHSDSAGRLRLDGEDSYAGVR